MLLPDLQSRLRIALTNTLVNEWSLFSPTAGTSRPSQRSIAFHLGWNLRPLVERSWDIDTEYERSGMALESTERLADHRSPDLVVHRRGKLGPEHNLLLVELSADGSPEGEEYGLQLQRRFGYRYAVALSLRLHDATTQWTVAPTWRWSVLEQGPVTEGPQDVYLPEVLGEITQRGSRRGTAR
ncbi:hypothetical protein [Cellulomonas marina]|uniref:Uncharacterized protein n=1 Tax=Cellulomonas marina TaxID=988821 RepID=A0A1I1AFP5_9CELL|nr:hypothetical protein [Cellulomonas marina]GIG30369.1 hypothetical protein Cma02nite_29690 [Cellulomonas marina]SFB35153.1 hypothetical protein SAMN05421867_11678 [Cellulomonas marina]